MAGDLRVTSSVTLREEELQWRFSRSSGPGGQSVNTTDSRAELTVDLAATPAPSEHRSQLRNREAAAERLAQLLREALAPPPPRRRPTKPSRGAQRRRAEAKTRRSQTKSLRRRPSD